MNTSTPNRAESKQKTQNVVEETSGPAWIDIVLILVLVICALTIAVCVYSITHTTYRLAAAMVPAIPLNF